MVPGSLLLGNPKDHFTCGHEHGTGDRCIAFAYDEELFDRIGHDATSASSSHFRVPRVAPAREVALLIADSLALLAGDPAVDGEELGIKLAGAAMRMANGAPPQCAYPEASTIARVTLVVRTIDNEPNLPHRLRDLAQIARLSPYHFVRTFEAVTGTTPHQYVLRHRLRRAASRLRTECTKVLEIAFESGFSDVSAFNRSFKSEFGVSPRVYRSSGEGRDNKRMQDSRSDSCPGENSDDRSSTTTCRSLKLRR